MRAGEARESPSDPGWIEGGIMRMAVIGALALLTVGGCAMRSHIVLERDMKANMGKPVSVLVRKLGYPARQDMMLGAKIYSWDIDDCQLHVAVDKSERITHFDYQGSHHECGDMADDLDDGS
jgi:hypothetical protein